MSLEYQIDKFRGRFDATAKLTWYANCGYYRIEAVGTGLTEEEAKKSAALMLGQARAALHVAMIEGVPNRVPGATENAGA